MCVHVCPLQVSCCESTQSGGVCCICQLNYLAISYLFAVFGRECMRVYALFISKAPNELNSLGSVCRVCVCLDVLYAS